MSEHWNGFACETFLFETRKAVVVFPDPEKAVGRLVLKTEYWDAFPEVEIQLLNRGYHLAYVSNTTRFATQEDCDRKARFVQFLSQKYGLSEKCIPVGMSCGGAHAVRFAGFYPELVACMYIDAPVLNYLNYPGQLNDPDKEGVWSNEFIVAYPGIKRYQLLRFGEHPMNMADVLVSEKIPVIMVCGDADTVVLYEENGKLLEEAFEGTDLLKSIVVAGRGHHPHGIPNGNEEIVRFLVAHSDVRDQE